MKYETIENRADRVTIRLEGSLESSSDLDVLEPHLKGGKSVLLDLSGVVYINSSGFGAMVEETLNFKDAGLSLTFRRLAPEIRKTMDVLGARELLYFAD